MIYPPKKIGVKDIMDSPIKADKSFWLAEEKAKIITGYIN